MVMGRISLLCKDNSYSLRQALRELAQKEVLVGIPEETSSRPGGETNSINNAELLYIHSHGIRRRAMIAEMSANMNRGMKYSRAYQLYLQGHGSPLLAVPPRPVLEPAIKENKNVIAKYIAAACKASLDLDPQTCEADLNKAGMLAVSAARGWFENPANGWPPNSPKTVAKKGSDAPLIDTGEMRKSITYVLREKE